MSDIRIPAEYNRVMPYLILKDAAGAIGFMKEVLGAVVHVSHMRDDGQVIMHAEVLIGDSMIMLAEATDQYPPDTCALFVYVADADAAYERALAMGATSVMGLVDQPYGRTCGVKDPYGNKWWITTHTGK